MFARARCARTDGQGVLTMTLSGEGLVGRTIGGYQLQRVLGRGGMGMVYEALKEGSNEKFAVKIPHEELLMDAEYLRRFYHEAKIALGIKHPNIVETLEVNNEGEHHYIAMELISGRPLSMIIKREVRLDLKTAIRYGIQLASALDALDRRGIVHRDIKPKNVVVDEAKGIARLMDFGIARARMRGREDSVESKTDWVGTKFYLAPEQINEKRADHVSDVYSLGVTIFEMITGRVPFDSNNPLELARMITSDPAPEIEQFVYNAPQELQEVLDMAMSKDPADRYRHASELSDDLSRILSQLK